MTLRDLRRMADSKLADEVIELAGKLSASPSTFGLTAPIAASLTSLANTFESSLVDWNNAQDAMLNAKYQKNADREAVLDAFGTYLSLMYATPTVTGGAITSLGLDPHSDHRSPVVPFQPESLLATPFADGTVRLTWNKGDNKYGVVYQVEMAEADATEWTVAQATTKTRMTLSGMTPGEPRWFRVRATKNGDASEYSFPAGIYIPLPSGSGAVEEAA